MTAGRRRGRLLRQPYGFEGLTPARYLVLLRHSASARSLMDADKPDACSMAPSQSSRVAFLTSAVVPLLTTLPHVPSSVDAPSGSCAATAWISCLQVSTACSGLRTPVCELPVVPVAFVAAVFVAGGGEVPWLEDLLLPPHAASTRDKARP